jgi:phosphomevalonate kinase
MVDKHALLAEVHSAQSEVTKAEEALSKLLREIRASARAEKTTISKALEEAFDTLRGARQHLGTLEKMAGGDDEDEDGQ